MFIFMWSKDDYLTSWRRLQRVLIRHTKGGRQITSWRCPGLSIRWTPGTGKASYCCKNLEGRERDILKLKKHFKLLSTTYDTARCWWRSTLAHFTHLIENRLRAMPVDMPRWLQQDRGTKRVFKLLSGLNKELQEVFWFYSQFEASTISQRSLLYGQTWKKANENNVARATFDNSYCKARPYCDHCKCSGHTWETNWKIHVQSKDWKLAS